MQPPGLGSERHRSSVENWDSRWWFSPLPGEMIQFDRYFSDGLKPPTSICFEELLGFRYVARLTCKMFVLWVGVMQKRSDDGQMILSV